MESYILAHQIGFFLFGLSGFVLSFFLLAWVFILWRKMCRLQSTLDVFLSGKDAQTLEDTILRHDAQLIHLDHEISELYAISNKVHHLGLSSMHKTQLIRFNPFKDLGGNQSFSLALLDGHNNGTVLSSLHTREGTRIYAKEVVYGNATTNDFTNEEREAITLAMQKKLKTSSKK